MPTGYTADVLNGQSFSDFVWRCARGMGALITMRDEPLTAPIPEAFEPSSFYADRLMEVKAKLDRYNNFTIAEIAAEGERLRNAAITAAEQYATTARVEDEKYKAMMAAVSAWEPPTPDHVGLKEFMMQQLTTSLDDPAWANQRVAEAKAMTAPAYYAAALHGMESDVVYFEKCMQEEQERTDSRNAWLKALRESVPPTITAAAA